MKEKSFLSFFTIFFLFLFFAMYVLSSTNSFKKPASSRKGNNADLCESLSISQPNLKKGKTLNLEATGKNSDIRIFTFEFFNINNQLNGKPKPIMFEKNKKFIKQRVFSVTQKKLNIPLSFDEFDKPDLNWKYYKPRPKNIWVEAYLTDSSSKTSKYTDACAKKFTVSSVDPTPTINPNCTCSAQNTCTNVCFFDKYPQTAYHTPKKCAPVAGVYSTSPTKKDKTNWCRYYYNTKGDADGDGKTDFKDYFYYAQVKAGGKIPVKVNVDFDGNNIIDSKDKEILFKTSL